jgi:hypothetical protein
VSQWNRKSHLWVWVVEFCILNVLKRLFFVSSHLEVFSSLDQSLVSVQWYSISEQSAVIVSRVTDYKPFRLTTANAQLYIQYTEPDSYVINKTIPTAVTVYSTSVTIQQVHSLPPVQLLPTSLYHPHPANKKLTCSVKRIYFNKLRINLSECRGRSLIFFTIYSEIQTGHTTKLSW